eukprot:TRINITY_DN67844_c0_g1_i1.p1 TRINITY_DN67844_c0_g1~~TRINITY_DN67844_c0_g1_i1.p1  ORF type:complete len:236 (+),score=46.60 TRINITY_DN67844_c0_g1_i1:137-844(+)
MAQSGPPLDGSVPTAQKLRQTLKAGVARNVQTSLRSLCRGVPPEATAKDIESVVTKAQSSWDELVALSKAPSYECKGNGGKTLHLDKWTDLLDAKYRRLAIVSRELDSVDSSYQWSKRICQRESKRLSDLGLSKLIEGSEELAEGELVSTFNDAAHTLYMQGLAEIACSEAEIRGAASVAKRHKEQIRELRNLRSHLEEVKRVRREVQDCQQRELQALYARLQDERVPLGPDDRR